MALSSAVKSLTEAAFSKSKATTPAPVPLTPKKDIVDESKEDDLNSDTVQSLSSSFPSFASFKGQRAFEHDRQRAKRTEDYIRTQEVKAFRTLSKPTPALSERQKKDVSTRKDRPIGSSVLDDDETDLHSILEGVRNPIATKEPSAVQQNVEVKLVDLIKPGSIRKTRKNKDAEFELIPAVRPVIVLDELAFMHDTPPPRDLEQEWQHVYHSDSDDSETSVPTHSPTYANVVIGI
ncbi:hypothetical protein F5050DRAFT_676864 [Lentinula boryana]|uniref:Uncharacterized protein n=1 Tax=Lentinula boryana TaxID=40481 RepID=A0ABQ8Q4A0_9AGAR|nr:hypothetical protein F5050DRAFT_676864 [Lentinula boryana]